MGPSGRLLMLESYWTAWDRFHAGDVFGQSSPYKGDSTRFSEVASGSPTSTCILRVDG